MNNAPAIPKRRYDAAFNCEIIMGDNLYRVWFNYTPGAPEVRYQRNGDPGWPADPAEINLVGSEDEMGNEILFDEKNIESVYEQCERHVEEMRHDRDC